MPETINLNLGGIEISLVADQPAGDYDLLKRAFAFSSPNPPDVTLQVHCGWFPELTKDQVTFDTNHAWQLFLSDGNLVIDGFPNFSKPIFKGVFPPDFHSGDIYVSQIGDTPNRYIFPLSFPLGELFLMNLLATGLGMLFHATGVIYEGEGYLFAGNGGAGKTTLARLWQNQNNAQVVNDDKVILRLEPEGFFLYGTPWHGEGGIAQALRAPLKRIFTLKKATHNHASHLDPMRASAELLARAFIPLWDAEKMNFILEFLDKLSQAVPCQELGFLPDSSATEYVLSLE